MTDKHNRDDELRALFAKRAEPTPAPPFEALWHSAKARVQRHPSRGRGVFRGALSGGLAAAAALALFFVLNTPTAVPPTSSPSASIATAPPAELWPELDSAFTDTLVLGSADYVMPDLYLAAPTDFLLEWDIPAWAKEKRSTP